MIFAFPSATTPVTIDLVANGDITVAAVSGELDNVVADFLRLHFAAALAARPSALVLDFAAVGFCSATVLGVVAEVAAEADAAGVPWAFVSDQRAVLRPVELTGLDEVLHPLPDVPAARDRLALTPVRA